MIIDLEIFFTFALLYPKIKADVEHEEQEMDGVEMCDYYNESVSPTYVNVNNIILPVGGGMNRVIKILFTKHISKDKKKEYCNFYQIEDEVDTKLSQTKTSHINTQEAFIKTFKYYNIPTDIFAINLPLDQCSFKMSTVGDSCGIN
jgi:hypothetical protein